MYLFPHMPRVMVMCMYGDFQDDMGEMNGSDLMRCVRAIPKLGLQPWEGWVSSLVIEVGVNLPV